MILERQSMMGMTAHLIDSEKVDYGPILAKADIPIFKDIGYMENEKRLYALMGSVAGFLIRGYKVTGKFISAGWGKDKGRYYKPLDKEAIEKIVNSSSLAEFYHDDSR